MFKAIIKIAYRNISSNKKRSILIGLAIFLSTFLLILSNATMNGAKLQTLKNYVNLQSGHVTVIWRDVKKVSNMDPLRLLSVKSFHIEEDIVNKKAITRLKTFLKQKKSEIKAFYPIIHRLTQVIVRDKINRLFIYSMVPDEEKFLIDSKTIRMERGRLLSNEDYSICISQNSAQKFNLDLGDLITVEANTPYGAKNSLDFIVTGIYGNMADWDNMYGFISEKNARELFDFDPGYFDIGQIILKRPEQANRFAKELDAFLAVDSTVLHAESFSQASKFYTKISEILKSFFSIFIFFLLIIIAMGLRATIKMNLYERMKEFGTLRAIGYSRFLNYTIIFCEVFLLSIIALSAALFVGGIIVIILGQVGVYVGPGPITFSLGGESFYPSMKLFDVFFSIFLILVFSLISTMNPGLRLCYQNITDLLAKQQKRVYPTKIWITNLFNKFMNSKRKA